MPANTVVGGDSLARGLRTEFINTWRSRFRGIEAAIGPIMELGVNSDKIEEIYGYYETAPYPRRRPWGEEVHTESFRARNFTVENVSWDSSVEWFKHQRLFDQLKDLERAARQAGKNFATLSERILFQIMLDTTDTDRLGVIPNAPDGVALYSALDGDSVDRFGVSGGNIISAGGVGSSDAVRIDFFKAITRMGQFQDTKGQPVHDQGILDQSYTIFYNIVNTKVVREAFIQGRTLEGGAALTNIIMDSGMKIRLIGSQRITDNDMPVFLDSMDPKPIFEQVAQPLDEQIETEANSDRARRTKIEGIFWETIRGYGVNLPLGTVLINN